MKRKSNNELNAMSLVYLQRYYDRLVLYTSEYEENFYTFTTGVPLWSTKESLFNEEEQLQLRKNSEEKIENCKQYLELVKILLDKRKNVN